MCYLLGLAALLTPLLAPTSAQAFCGFYVGQADADLFNRASKVVYTRLGDQSVITMASDYEGALSDFAMVVPVPTILEERDVRTVDPEIVDHLDRFSAPRLVEYFDDNPCEDRSEPRLFAEAGVDGTVLAMVEAQDMSVQIEREFRVDGYDIKILSASESDGLLSWLNANGYQTPNKALPVLEDYVAAGMKFFVAQVALNAQASQATLNPLQVSFESDEFMLPIRLGMVNAPEGESQELLAWFLTDSGQVEVRNYQTRRIPTDAVIPEEVREDFGDFYRRVFTTANVRQDHPTVFMEFGWDTSWCDPCAADPLSTYQLRELGVPSGVQPYVTRIHMRYEEATHPRDLALIETGNRDNFQGRYIIENSFDVSVWNLLRECARDYLAERAERDEAAAELYTELTGQDFLATVRYTPTHDS